jgi:hypothetical protein
LLIAAKTLAAKRGGGKAPNVMGHHIKPEELSSFARLKGLARAIVAVPEPTLPRKSRDFTTTDCNSVKVAPRDL